MTLPRLPALSIGTDICDINRIFKLLASETGLRFVRRVLTEDELSLDGGKKVMAAIANKRSTLKNPMKYKKEWDRPSRSTIQALEKAAQYMAGRWAAKEAVQKAYNIRRMNFQDIEIKTKSQMFPGSEPQVPPLLEAQEPEQDSESKFASHFKYAVNPLNYEKEPDPVAVKLEAMPGWGPPVAVIKGHGVYEDVYASMSISHDGEYAIASCIVDNQWPKRIRREETNSSQSDVD